VKKKKKKKAQSKEQKEMGYSISKHREMEEWKIKKAADHLQTGDLLLFAGDGKWSCLIQCVTESINSHTAIVIKTDYFGDEDPNHLYLLHSNVSAIQGLPNLLSRSKKPRAGVQLNSLTRCLKCCPADAHVRQLFIPKEGPHFVEEKSPLIFTKTITDSARRIREKDFDLFNPKSVISRFIQEIKHKKYESHMSEMMASCCLLSTPEDNKDTLFCSELVADFYKSVGILPEYANASKYLPRDFAEMCMDDEEYEEINAHKQSFKPSVAVTGCSFGPIYRLVS
jgi:hypothetical protein